MSDTVDESDAHQATINARQQTELMKCVKPDETPKTCGAKTRNGSPCKLAPLIGKRRCKLHGGASPSGPQSATFKHGFYSKAIPKNLRGDFHNLLADPKLLEGKAEIAILQIRLRQLTARCGTNENNHAWSRLRELMNQFRNANTANDEPGMLVALTAIDDLINGQVDDEQAWTELDAAIERVSKISEREWKRVIANQQYATAEQVRALMASVTDAVLTYVTDTQARAAIAERINRLRVLEPIPVDAEPNGNSG